MVFSCDLTHTYLGLEAVSYLFFLCKRSTPYTLMIREHPSIIDKDTPAAPPAAYTETL